MQPPAAGERQPDGTAEITLQDYTGRLQKTLETLRQQQAESQSLWESHTSIGVLWSCRYHARIPCDGRLRP